MKRFRIRIGFISVLVALAMIITEGRYAVICLIAAAIHELGHIIAARLCKIRLEEFSLGMLGARLKTCERVYSYKKEIILCFCGPLFNFISAGVVYSVCKIYGFTSENISVFILYSLVLGTLNLLPVKSFDGGRIFESLALLFISPTTADAILNALSFLCVFTLWCTSVYFLLIYSSSLCLFTFSVSLFCKLFISET